MSQQMWNHNQNLNSAQSSMPMLERCISNSSNYTPYDASYYYQNSSCMYANTNWTNRVSTTQTTNIQQFQVQSPECFSGCQQNFTTEGWNDYCETSECTHPERQGTQIRAPLPRVATTSKPAVNGVATFTTKARHCARISFVNDSDGSYTPVIKRKRKRTAFTTSQIKVLEEQFHKRPYISPAERRTLTEKLQVSDKVIKVWFQNRRLKEKRERSESGSTQMPDYFTSNQPIMGQSNSNCSEITSSDDSVNDLYVALEQVISDDLKSSEEVTVLDNNVNYYEPISPQEFSHEINTTFVPVDPVLAFQNVLDYLES